MDDISARLAAFATAFTQDSRLFSLRFDDSALDSALLPLALQAEESLSHPYRIVVDCLGSDVHLPLKQLLGTGIDIAVPLVDGGERRLGGLVTRAEQLGADGGFARYRLTVEPALALLALRRNSRLFQEKSVVDIVALLLDEQIASNAAFARCFRHRSELSLAYPRRSFCQQYRESDLAFLSRLLREEGISYRFDFAHDEAAIGLHALVLFDAASALPPTQHARVRFHRADATEESDSLTQWQAVRQLRAGTATLASFDYKNVRTVQADSSSRVDQGDAGNALAASLNAYDPQTLYYATDQTEQARYAALRQQASDLQAKVFNGRGNVRGLNVGHHFLLDDHPRHDGAAESERRFVVLRLQLQARNNFPVESAVESANDNNGSALPGAGIHTEIDAVRLTVPIVPAYAHGEHAKPTARGIQTATVVGPAGEEIFTDALGRIKVQFHWARPQDHDRARHGSSAQRDDLSSCWIRVGQPSAGAGFGHQFIPRVGQEVVIAFLENDIDRPIVTGVIHNGRQRPPAFNGVGSLPANKRLSGIKSREHQGSGHNELLFDDTPGAIRAQLASEHGKTQLNLGFLIHPRRDGSGEARGEGFELRSDHAGAVRATQGLLITTESQSTANGKQLDRAAALQTLDSAVAQADQLGDAARAQQANLPETGRQRQGINGDWQTGATAATGHLHHLRDAAHNLERSSNTAADTASSDGSDAGRQPLLLVSGQHGISAATPQALAIASGSNLDQISARDTLQTTGRRWICNATESISLFVAGVGNAVKESVKLIAGSGDIQLQSQKGTIEIDGDHSLMINADSGSIIARADRELVLHCDGAQIKLSGGNIEISAPGTLSLQAAQQLATGPLGAGDPLPDFDHLDFAGKHRLVRPTDGQPLRDQPYRITLADGSTLEGITNANGETELLQSRAMELFKIEFPDTTG